jgi:hypothetical protein
MADPRECGFVRQIPVTAKRSDTGRPKKERQSFAGVDDEEASGTMVCHERHRLRRVRQNVATTNTWLDELMAEIGPDRQVAWHVLGVVLRTLRDRIPLGLAAHLGEQLPLLVRGSYYDR